MVEQQLRKMAEEKENWERVAKQLEEEIREVC